MRFQEVATAGPMAQQKAKAKAAATGDAAAETMVEYRFPHFIGIGAQKAGTTWLDRNLRRHPGLWLPPIKELQYFNDVHLPLSRRWTVRHRHDRGIQILRDYLGKVPAEDWNYRHIGRLADIIDGPISDDWYGRIFALAGADRICGEVTPDYAVLPPDGIRHILRLSPEVKIIFSLRDPIERSWSHIRMTARTRNITDDAKIEQFARNLDMLQRADYPAIIATWRTLIPSDRFLILFMDDIIARPTAVLEEVCAFLGVPFRDSYFPKAASPVHVGEAQAIPASVYAILRERLKPIYGELAGLYPEIAAGWAARHY